MRNKAFLPLIEQIIMIAVFAIISAVCIGCFSLARAISAETEYKDHAIILAQNTAERIKHDQGVNQEIIVGYTDTLTQTNTDNAVYLVTILPFENNDPMLGSAKISVSRYNQTIYTLTVCWQEVTTYAQ